MSLAGGLRELLRPPPHRGPLIAAGAVPFAVGVALLGSPLNDHISDGVQAAILLLTGGLLFWLGGQAPNENGVPPAYQSVLLVTGLPLIYAGLLTGGDAVGILFDPLPYGAIMWMSAVTGALALWAAFARKSAISLLLAAVLGAIALLSAWAWVFDARSATPYRWLLLVAAGGLVLGSLALRATAPRHAEVLANAAGLAIVAVGATPLVLSDDLPAVWQVVLLAAGVGGVAFGALDRSPGPAYLGVVNLLLFLVWVGDAANPVVWPIILLAGGGAMLVAGLRPRRPLPPEPDPYRAGEAPLAARAGEEEMVARVRDDA